MALTVVQVKNAKPSEKAYKMADERGLYLLINPNGSKLWKLKYRFAGFEKKLSLGAYPEVSLAALGMYVKKLASNSLITSTLASLKILSNVQRSLLLKTVLKRLLVSGTRNLLPSGQKSMAHEL
ncbi:Arm DNA-binding domain-containing protein [Rickettsiella endosymbiont of Dermanyssus gallinae]|uniref:Arm DNA-binding domain-containing protein n=1 Tax=Rickettsiella endosymbiont of Dermanyssus gallinae TaxID=2856608 RepID=UPI001C52B8DA|nr:Arm DNA-binding domain-containing protein [Rickettsiella endosymbiont of Dermanyssus gallinae]